jgi:peptidoglycan/LPS O-acetylase OafA/YrhL
LFSTTTLAVVALVALFGVPTRAVLFSGRSLALQPPLLQQWSSGLNWNYPSWSISTEAEAYLYFVFFAGLLLTGKYPRLMALCCVGVLAALSVRDAGRLNYFVGMRAILRTLAGFSLGVLLYRAYLRRVTRRRQWSGVAAILLVGAFSILELDFLAVCASACLIYDSVDRGNVIGKLLDTRFLVVLGDWSYSIYLLHAPVHFTVMIAFAAFHHPVAQLGLLAARALLLTTALVVVMLAAVHYRYVERPLRQWVLRTAEPWLWSDSAIV